MPLRPPLCFEAKPYLCLLLVLGAACHESDAEAPLANDASSAATGASVPAKGASDASAVDTRAFDASSTPRGDAGTSQDFDAQVAPPQPDAQPATRDGATPISSDASEPTAADGGTTTDKYAPFALDCASLPSNGACQGGPREVLLAINKFGRTLMFDPSDGHFLGHLKDETQGLGDFNTSGYRIATQGPDQCIWTAFDASGAGGSADQQQRAIERWNTDGSFRDHIIPRGKHFRDGDADRLANTYTLAFSASEAYVAADGRLTRFTLAGNYVAEALQYDPAALLVASDGSLLVQKGGVTLVQGGVERGLLSQVNVGQLWYAGQGKLLVSGGSGASFKLDVDTRMASEWQPDDSDVVGVAQLKNGQYLITGDDVEVATLDPAAVPKGTIKSVVAQLGTSFGSMRQIGRACLSEAFLSERAPKPAVPEAQCAAPSGDALFEEHFDSGAFVDGRYGDFRALDVPLATVSIADGSLRIEGGDQHSDTVELALADLKPSYVGYRVKVADPNHWGAYFRLQDGNLQNELALVYASNGVLGTSGSEAAYPIEADSWIQVQLRDIDWQRRTFDLYFDCKRVADDIAMGGEKLSRLVLYNFYEGAVSQFDDLVIK